MHLQLTGQIECDIEFMVIYVFDKVRNIVG